MDSQDIQKALFLGDMRAANRLVKGKKYEIGQSAWWRTGFDGEMEQWKKTADGPHGWKRVPLFEGHAVAPLEPLSTYRLEKYLGHSSFDRLDHLNTLMTKQRANYGKEIHEEALKDHLTDVYELHPSHVQQILEDKKHHSTVRQLAGEFLQQGEHVPKEEDIPEDAPFLGQGGYGRVYYDPETKQAIKYMTTKGRGEIENEFYIGTRVDEIGQQAGMKISPEHYGISSELSPEGVKYGMGIEYLAGRQTLMAYEKEMFQKWEEESVSEEQLRGFQAEYGLNIAKALSLMGTNGIAHNDIKEDNIVIDPVTRDICIIDFGEATEDWMNAAFETDSASMYAQLGTSFSDPKLYEDLRTLRNDPYFDFDRRDDLDSPEAMEEFVHEFYSEMGAIFETHGKDF